METRFVQYDAAVSEYFKGDRAAFAEAALFGTWKLLLRLPVMPVFLSPPAHFRAPAKEDGVSWERTTVHGWKSAPWQQSVNLLLAGVAVPIRCVYARKQNETGEYRSAWFRDAADDELVKYNFELKHTWYRRDEIVATIASSTSESVPPPTRWPWGAHETKLLAHLASAGRKFWALYDPSDASTAPVNSDVVTWLMEQGVAERNAQVMATMLRADGLPPGPRK